MLHRLLFLLIYPSIAGNISVGNIPLYLPIIIGQIKEQPKRRYLLLHALKEVITKSDKATKLGDASNEIWTLLIESGDAEQEEGTRSVVAECLGRLALTNPEKFLPELKVSSFISCVGNVLAYLCKL